MIYVSRVQLFALALVAVLVGVGCGGDDAGSGDGEPAAGGGVPTTAQDDPTAAQSDPTTAQSDPTAVPPDTTSPDDSTLIVSSSGFNDGQPIPVVFTCDGDDVSPSLDWGTVPSGTESIALLLLDPDAPGGTFTHWVIANLPADIVGLPEGWDPASSPDVVLGRTGFGREGYGGPCPPRGSSHRYEFRVYALDAVVDFDAGGSAADLLDAMDGHILAEGLLVGTYSR